ncbi:MAG: CBS domain-containing protein [Solirubrobacterales bacterium]|nr:CBS domain-containing protein [Solirubrobacterales bacterium]
MSEASPAPPEVTRFLREYPPFDSLPASTVERVAAAAEVEFHRAGTTIIPERSGPLEHLWVVRSGEVEIVHEGRVLDLLAEGELFGHASMLSGLPTGFEARAAEDTLTYRIPGAVAREPLAAPAGLRFVARSLLERSEALADLPDRKPAPDPAQQPVGSLLRDGPVVCTPETTIREAAQMMAAAPSTSVVVDLGNGSLGILTDRDLRARVVAGGLPGEALVSAAMSAPAYTSSPDRLGGDVLLEMLDRGIRHFPIVSATGRVLGVLEDVDVIAAQARSPFFLRHRVARAQTVDEVVAAAGELHPMVVALHDARVAATGIMAVYAVVVDALTRRLLELALEEMGAPPAPFAWLALGSQGRREMLPSSDVDSALVWFGDTPGADVRSRLIGIGERVTAGLRRCGLREDTHGASGSNPPFVRSFSSWQRAARSWIEDPSQEKAIILVSVVVDSRPVWGLHAGTPVTETFRLARRSGPLLRLLARFALSYRPPTGFLRGLVVEHSGEHRGRLDLKHGGMIPIVDLARWAGMAAGVTSASTVERLHASAAAGTLSRADAQTLEDAFELVNGLRLEHQVEELRAGREPDDYIDPAALSRLTRTHLKEAFRAIAAIQKQVSADLTVGVR